VMCECISLCMFYTEIYFMCYMNYSCSFRVLLLVFSRCVFF